MIKQKKIGFLFTVIISLFVCAFSCKKEPAKDLPMLSTMGVNITTSSANITTVTTGGKVTVEGSSAVVARGVCWSLSKDPGPTTRYKDSITTNGKGLGDFSSIIPGMLPGKTYYIKAYATNSDGTSYGNQVVAVMLAVLPVVSTSAITVITESMVNCGGDILSNGGADVLIKGVCWSNTKNPTIANFSSNDGSGDGSFVSQLTKLIADSTYYIRSYATNMVGTSYGNERSFSTGKMLVKDKDGNFYHFVAIGSQVWLAENLRTTRFSDSTSIPLVEDNSTWSSSKIVSPAYCWYNNSVDDYKNPYGALYNWFAVSTGKLCPTGWHVPTDTEWTTLTDFLGGATYAGGMLKESTADHWKLPNLGATNETRFSALPGGWRSDIGVYDNIGFYGNWWSTTSVNATVANFRYLYYGNGASTKSFISKKYGLSVRCLKN